MIDVSVTDLNFVAGRPETALVYPGPRAAVDDPLLLQLAQQLDAGATDQTLDAFAVTVPGLAGDESWIFRGQRVETIDGGVLIFRRLARRPPDLSGLLPVPVVNILLHPALCSGGLLLIAGGPGQGKTTTLAATVAGRLKTFGGVCVALEDPPEIPLHGRHGDGLCLQMQLSEALPLEVAIHKSLRMFPVAVPTLLMIGEIRTREAAREALAAALNGTLVCVTLHATSPVEAIQRLVGLAGGDEYVRGSVASSLRLILHQRLVNRAAQITPLVIADKGGEALRGNIRAGKLELLASDLQYQKRALDQGKALLI